MHAPFVVDDATEAIRILRDAGLTVIKTHGSDTAYQLTYRARLSLEAKIAAYLAGGKDEPEPAMRPGCPWCEVSAPNHNAGCPAETLDQIAAILDGQEWNADTTAEIADVIIGTGRRINTETDDGGNEFDYPSRVNSEEPRPYCD